MKLLAHSIVFVENPMKVVETLVKRADRLMNCVEKPMILVEHVYEHRMKCMGDSYEFCGETYEFCENPMIFCRRSMKFIFISWISATCPQKIET